MLYPFGQWRAARRLFFLAFGTLFWVVLALPKLLLFGQFPYWCIRGWHRAMVWAANIRITQIGTPCNENKILFISNHISYKDIVILGSIIPNADFIAKSEVSGWAIMGWLSRSAGTKFVVRKRAQTDRQANMLTQYLQAGKRLTLFAEGTSTMGIDIGPLKPSLFEPVIESGALVQPLVIKYTRIDNLPMNSYVQPLIGWYADMDLSPHVWQMLQLHSIGVVVEFLPPINPKDFQNRKELCHHAHQIMCQAFHGIDYTAKNYTGKK